MIIEIISIDKDKEKEINEGNYELETLVFKDILLESFIVNENDFKIFMVVHGRAYYVENTEENKDKLTMVLNNSRYGLEY